MKKVIPILCFIAVIGLVYTSVKDVIYNQFADLEDTSLQMQGLNMNPREVNRTIEDLKKRPTSFKDHVLLAAYYGDKQQNNTNKYALWLIKHYPAAPIFHDPEFVPPSHAQEALWNKQLLKYPRNIKVMANAASCLQLNDASRSIAIYKKLMQLQPSNHKWPLDIARIIQYNVNPESGPSVANANVAKHALKYAQMSFNLAKSNEDKLDVIDQLMMDAYYSQNYPLANEYALMVNKYIPSWDPISHNDVIYHSYMMQGLVALRNKNISAADHFLLKSGQTSGSAPLDSFGPNMMLAEQLLRNGQKAVVLQFLKECSTFWNAGPNPLQHWITEVKQGKQPDFSMQDNY